MVKIDEERKKLKSLRDRERRRKGCRNRVGSEKRG